MTHTRFDRTALVESAIFLILGVVSVGEGIHLYVTKDPSLLYAMMKPGFYVAFLGLALIALAIGHLIASGAAVQTPVEAAPEKSDRRFHVYFILGGLAAYGYLIGIIGYALASFAFFVFAFRLFGIRIFPNGVLLSLLFVVINYFVFVEFCSVIWPAGVLIDIP